MAMYYPKSPFLRNPLVESQLIKRNDTSILNELLAWLCQTPTITTYRVNLLRSTREAFKQRLEKLLNEKYENPPKVYVHPEIPEIVCIAKTAHFSKPPLDQHQCKEIIVDNCCGAAILRGSHIFAPGVLGMESGTKLNEEVQVYADLGAKCKKGTNIHYEAPQKTFIGVGVVRMQRHQLYGTQVANEGIAVQMTSNISGVPSIGDLSAAKLALLQNLPSIVCVRALNPQPGERVLDMCSAPGNKTSHIAEMMRDEGAIVALDKTEKKIAYVRHKIEKNEFTSIQAFAYDSTKVFDERAGEESLVPPFGANTFDRILLDAPCSALGNRPLLASTMTPKMLQSFPNVQRKLFANAVPMLRQGGVLVYSTCTVTGEENESMVAWALQKFPELELVDAVPKLGGPGLADLGLSESERQMVQRFGPSATNADTTIDTVGFFIVKFVKKPQQESNLNL